VPITITATAEEGTIKAFRGVVQSVENDTQPDSERRWRVKMRE
jgi:hypothetical protein